MSSTCLPLLLAPLLVFALPVAAGSGDGAALLWTQHVDGPVYTTARVTTVGGSSGDSPQFATGTWLNVGIDALRTRPPLSPRLNETT